MIKFGMVNGMFRYYIKKIMRQSLPGQRGAKNRINNRIGIATLII